jgi:hypothetical protein
VIERLARAQLLTLRADVRRCVRLFLRRARFPRVLVRALPDARETVVVVEAIADSHLRLANITLQRRVARMKRQMSWRTAHRGTGARRR